MTYRELEVPGAWEITPRLHGDVRGVFLEYFRAAELETAIGHAFDLQQANCSVSAAGVVRGIHFADVPPGQAKYVTCATGAVLDIVVDIRVGSPTFGRWDSVLLDDVSRRAIYLPEGVGHAFMSLEDGSTILYLCSSGYAPDREHGISPLDSDLQIDWPTTGRDGQVLTPTLSDKDRSAPTLQDARRQGMLPTFESTTAWSASRRAAREEDPAL